MADWRLLPTLLSVVTTASSTVLVHSTWARIFTVICASTVAFVAGARARPLLPERLFVPPTAVPPGERRGDPGT